MVRDNMVVVDIFRRKSEKMEIREYERNCSLEILDKKKEIRE